MTSHSRRWTTALLLSATLSACSGSMEPTPTWGTIELTVTTTGTDIDPDGYSLGVAGSPTNGIPANGTVTWTGGAGNHAITIGGLAFNCEVTSSPTTALVTLGDTTHIDVRVSCGPYLGNGIIYISTAFGNGEVMVMRPDGSRRQRLTTDQAAYATPAVSPDGQTIAATSKAGSGSWSGIYLMDRFGKGRTKLAGHDASDSHAVWSPDGTKLAFTSMLPSPSSDYGVFVVNRDGTGLSLVSPGPVDQASTNAPAWSPDGTRLMYRHRGALNVGDLMVVNVDGTGATSLGINGHAPAWSPDGSRIAYQASSNTKQTIFVADPNGANSRQLLTPVDGDETPQWSPNGRQLVFLRREIGAALIYKVGADATGLTKLTEAVQTEWDPRWTPTF
ncbi:MAG: hypothetical protein ACJ8AD_15410 [Gemmatimonadaceae bacterium]